MKIILKHGKNSIDLPENLTAKFTANNNMTIIHHGNGNTFPVYFKSVEINSESIIIESLVDADVSLMKVFISKNA